MQDWLQTRLLAVALFSVNIFHVSRYPGLYHHKTKPLLCIDSANKSNGIVVFKIINTWANFCWSSPKVSCSSCKHSPSSHVLTLMCAWFSLSPLLYYFRAPGCYLTQTIQEQKMFSLSFSHHTSQNSQGVVHSEACMEPLRDPPARSPGVRILWVEETHLPCQVLISSNTHHRLHGKCPGQSLQQTGALRPVWDACIFLVHQITLVWSL